MIASLSGIRYRYKGASADALQGITLEVKRGEVLGLIGPDGAGKTTLLRCMAGVLAPCAGTMQLPSGAKTNAIGYMSQKFSLYEDLSIRENLRLFAVLRNIPTAVSAEEMPALLETAGLAPFAERLAGKLSGGMKQRVALIRTLALKPEILLLDEPFSALDFQTRLIVSKDISNIIKKEHKTFCQVKNFEYLCMPLRENYICTPPTCY